MNSDLQISGGLSTISDVI